MNKKVLFISESCLLDHKSGAARSVSEILNGLADHGWDCQAMTMGIFDGPEQSFKQSESVGTFISDQSQKFKNDIYITQSTLIQHLRPWELKAYIREVKRVMNEDPPAIVLTYSSELLRNPLAWAQNLGCKTVFYLANAGYADRIDFSFQSIDHFLAPSKALCDLYQQTMGLEVNHIKDLISTKVSADNLDIKRLANRKKRMVLMVNPEPSKGGLFFINLAKQVKMIDPEIRFSAVETRFTKSDWLRLGVKDSDLDYVEWLPSTVDMSEYYFDTSILLVPSLGYEASGRVIVEALKWGIPVLAMNNGGIEEQLNKGGFLFELPKKLKENHFAAADHEDLDRWGKYIGVLQNNDEIYKQSVQLALDAASSYDPLSIKKKYAQLFEEFLSSSTGASLDKKTKDALENYRLSMRLKREQINTSLEQNHESSLTDVTIKADPYQELLLMSMNQSAIKGIVLQMKAGEYRKVKPLLENYIKVVPEDIVALGMLAEVMSRMGDNKMAVELMSRVVVLAPGFLQGHQQLIEYLNDVNDAERALKHSFILIEKNPLQWKYLILHASILVAANKFTEAIRIYDAVFKQTTGSAFHWIRYAFVKKILGEADAAIKALRTALDRDPLNTGAWFELSNMKIPVLDHEDIQKMEKLVVGGEITDKVKLSELHFSLGKAYEDSLAYEESFEHYEKANKLRRSTLNFDISDIRAKVDSLKSILNQELIEKIQSKSKSNDAPIFIVGLHRSGTTLVEQILSSHSYVEGTRELPYMIEIAQDLKALNSEGQHVFNEKLIKDLGVADLRILSNQYLSQARKEKNTNKKFMIDKMPNNWLYVWLIHILFPRAKIIDIRKQPMSSGFSLYKMNFYKDVDHAFDQKEIAQFYIEYVNFMKHMDSIMPQKIHHIKYENLVTDSVSEIKRLLDFCELPDEKSCYRHWEYKRAVQTPSAEQVRQPIYDNSKDLWKNYAQWLAPMQETFNK